MESCNTSIPQIKIKPKEPKTSLKLCDFESIWCNCEDYCIDGKDWGNNWIKLSFSARSNFVKSMLLYKIIAFSESWFISKIWEDMKVQAGLVFCQKRQSLMDPKATNALSGDWFRSCARAKVILVCGESRRFKFCLASSRRESSFCDGEAKKGSRSSK